MSTDFGVRTSVEESDNVESDLSQDSEQNVEQNEHQDKRDNVADPRMKFMLESLPKLSELFDVHCRIGSGTFSSVYLATLKSENREPFQERKKFAIKYLLPTSHPKRIEQELECLQKIGGSENVVNIHFCMRNRDSVVFVMPYLSHERYMDYLMDMGPKETQLYIKNLLIALRSVHKFNVIHRDVKPANFLYDRCNKRFLLVDMGLAHHVDDHSSGMPKLNSLTSTNKRKRSSERENGVKDSSPILQNRKKIMLDTNNATVEYNKVDNGIKSPLKQLNTINKFINTNIQPINIRSQLCNKRTCNNNILGTRNDMLKSVQNKNLITSSLPNNTVLDKRFVTTTNPFVMTNVSNKIGTRQTKNSTGQNILQNPLDRNIKAPDKQKDTVNNKIKYNTNARARALNRRSVIIKSNIPSIDKNQIKSNCICFKKLMVCNICCGRKALRAKREGTPGFRPPEVLLRYIRQTTAVDIWAAGIILLSILSRCHPFFEAPDDLTALAEMISLFGTEKMKNAANVIGRCLTVSCPEIKETNLRQVCDSLKNRETASDNKIKYNLCEFPDSAYDLLERLLDVNPFTRITAVDALNHAFFKENLVQ